MITLDDKLKKAGCPYRFFPEALKRKKFTELFRNRIRSTVYPSLKESLTEPGSIACFTPDQESPLEYYSSFGYLYTYCVNAGLPDNLLPKYLSKEEVLDSLSVREYDQIYTRATLFIDLVNADDTSFSPEIAYKFSNFVYSRYMKGYSTVLCLHKSLSTCTSITPFLKTFLANESRMISTKD